MRAKRTMALLLLVAVLVNLSGCWSRKETENLAIVSAIGLDKVDIEGQQKWRVTIQIVRPSEMGGRGGQQKGQDSGKKPFWVASSVGQTIEDALINMKTRSPRRLFLAHTNVVVLGERAAREGVQEVLDFFIGERDIRLRAWVLTTKGQALDVLRAGPEMERLPIREMVGLITNTQPVASKAYVVTVKDFVNQLIAPGRDAAASRIEVFTPVEQLSSGDAEDGAQPTVRLAGAAVFKKDRLAGWMGDQETRGFLYVINKAEGGVIPLESDKQGEENTSFMMTRSRCRITPKIQDGRVTFNLDIKTEGDLEEVPCGVINPKKIDFLEKKVSRKIKASVEEAIRLNQQEHQADIFGFGQRLYQKFPQVWKAIEKDWDDIYPTVEVSVKVSAMIRRTGMIGATPEIK